MPAFHRACVTTILGLLMTSAPARGADLEPGLTLDLSLQPLQPAYLIGEPVSIDVFLTNTGTAAVTVPASLDNIIFIITVTNEANEVRAIEVLDTLPESRLIIPAISLPPGNAVGRRLSLDTDPRSGERYFPAAGRQQLQARIGMLYESPPVFIDIAEPQGRNAEAWRELQGIRSRIAALPMKTRDDRVARHKLRREELMGFLGDSPGTVYERHVRIALAQELLAEKGKSTKINAPQVLDLLEPLERADGELPLKDQVIFLTYHAQLSLGNLEAAAVARDRLHRDYPRSALIGRLGREAIDFSGRTSGKR